MQTPEFHWVTARATLGFWFILHPLGLGIETSHFSRDSVTPLVLAVSSVET